MKSLYLPLMALVLSVFCTTAKADYAGMLVVAKQGDGHYALLVKDRSRDHFELPAGKVERGDRLNSGEFVLESSYDTALRETVEETRGYLGRRLLMQSSDAEVKIRYGKFEMFLARIDSFDLGELRQIPMPKGGFWDNRWDPMREIVDYAWVSVAQLQQSDTAPVVDESGRRIAVHPMLAEEVRQAQQLGWFNADDD